MTADPAGIGAGAAHALGDPAGFVAALLDPDRSCPAGLHSWNGSEPAPRFAVHRNNIMVSLVDTLAGQFPVTQELVGTAFFRAMAQVFVRERPPRTRILAYAGTDFPDFIAAFAPAASVPYLADLARLEMARIEACHAADADPWTAAMIGRAMADPQRLARMRIGLHPSVRLLASPFAIHAIWAAHQGTRDLETVDPMQPEQVLVFRDGLEVWALPVQAGTGHFLARLHAGATLARAADAAADADPCAAFDLAGSIALLLRHPLVCQMEPSP